MSRSVARLLTSSPTKGGFSFAPRTEAREFAPGEVSIIWAWRPAPAPRFVGLPHLGTDSVNAITVDGERFERMPGEAFFAGEAPSLVHRVWDAAGAASVWHLEYYAT